MRPFWTAQGYFGEGRRWLEQLLAQEGPAAARVKALEALGWLADWMEDTERMEAAAEEALGLSAEAEVESRVEVSLLAFMGDAALARGDYERAEEWFEEGLALCREAGVRRESVWIRGAMSNVALDQGDHQHAKKLLEEAVVLSREMDDALTPLRETTGFPLLDGERAMHEPYLRAARSGLDHTSWQAAFAKGQAMPFEEAVEYALSAEAPASSSLVSNQPSDDSQPSRLTRRETEIATLVAQGFTNRTIASELVLSEHTVHHHVTNILKKLNLSSREQVASRLQD